MRIAVLVNTPAHAHVYRYAVPEWRRRGHDVSILARDYGCTIELLEYFDLPHVVYGRHEASPSTRTELGVELAGQLRGIARETRAFGPDLVFGRGPYAAFAGTLARARTVLVLDDEPTGFNHTISRPFADLILSPRATRRDLGRSHYTFEGFTECAYLHPDVYRPVDDVRERLGVGADEPYAIVRFNAFDALHDEDVTGFTPAQRRDLIDALADEVTVFVSDEGGDLSFEDLPAKRYDCHPALMHEAIREADLLVGDTGTMCIEAGLLGTPVVRHEDTGDHEIGEFTALERAGLLESAETYADAKRQALSLVRDPDATDRHERRRQAYVGDLTNLTDVLVDVADSQGSVDALLGDRPDLEPKRFSSASASVSD